jgi:hypothetical protein
MISNWSNFIEEILLGGVVWYSAAKFTIFHVNSREFTKFHTFSLNLFFTGMDGKES